MNAAMKSVMDHRSSIHGEFAGKKNRWWSMASGCSYPAYGKNSRFVVSCGKGRAFHAEPGRAMAGRLGRA